MAASKSIDKYIKASPLSTATLRAYKVDLKQFADYIHDIPLNQVKLRDYEGYAEHLRITYKSVTANRKLSAIRRLLSFCKLDSPEIIDALTREKNAYIRTDRSKKLKKAERLLQYLEECLEDNRLYDKAIRDISIIEILLYTGIGTGELLALERPAINLMNCLIETKKNIVYVGTVCMDHIKEYFKRYGIKGDAKQIWFNNQMRPINDQWIRRMLRIRAREAGIKEIITPNDFKGYKKEAI